ncbi:MAG TPA: PKD domain-containing protein, partial [Puia sp.]|nr:PKD domain-containing protein [Puia sp.]
MTRKLLAFCIGLLLTCVVNAQTAVINASATSGCSPLTVTFTDGSTGATSWNWNFGNGNTSTQQNPTIQAYVNPGSYTVTLSINGGPITSKTITVNESPVVNASASDLSGTSCFPLAESFKDLSTVTSGTITSWNWDFGDGNTSTLQNPSHTYIAANPVGFPVSLEVTSSNGCSATLKNPLKIIMTSGVTANFTTASSSGCKVPITINFNSTSTGPGTLTYSWSFGDGNTAGNVTTTSDTYTTAGTYPAILTVSSSSGCTAKDTQNIVAAGGSVQSTFSGPDSACVGTPVSFQNTSTPPPSVANWDFGDGTTASGQNVSHAYTTANTYTVKLVNVFGGCNDSVSKPILVLAPPVANFKADDSVTCSNSLTVNFTDLSTNATNWSWNFGDGTTSTAQSPSHTYTGYGNHTVTLTVSNSTGCSGTFAKTGYIQLVQPTVQITNLPLFGCAPFSLTPVIKDSLTGGVTSYLWDFGDGTTSTATTPPPHVYPAGTYVLKLTLTGAGGCTATTSDTVKVGTIKPTAAFTSPTTACVDQPIIFTDQSTGGVTQWLWDFGDGSTSANTNPSTSYPNAGSYTVKEIVYNNGCG